MYLLTGSNILLLTQSLVWYEKPTTKGSSITDRSNAVVMLWFSVACFGVRVSVTFHLKFVNIIFSSVWIAE